MPFKTRITEMLMIRQPTNQRGMQSVGYREMLAGAAGRELLESGDLSRGMFWAAMAQGLIHDILTCQALRDRIIAHPKAVVRDRPNRFMAA